MTIPKAQQSKLHNDNDNLHCSHVITVLPVLSYEHIARNAILCCFLLHLYLIWTYFWIQSPTKKQTNKTKQKKRRKIITKNSPWNSASPGSYIRSFAVFHISRFLLKNYNNALHAFEFLAHLKLWKRRSCHEHCLYWVWLNRSPKTGLFY